MGGLGGAAGGAETLVDGVVFGVDGEQFPAGFCCGSHDEFASSNQDFLVGKSDSAAEFHGFVSGFEADDTDSGGENHFGAGVGGNGEQALAALMDFREGKIFFAELAGEIIGELRSGDGDDFGTMALDLRKEFGEVVAGGEGHDFELFREGFDDV
jgi:hypothetical protein